MEAPRLLERCDRVKLRHAASKAAGRWWCAISAETQLQDANGDGNGVVSTHL